jgi:hypothetical protein
MQPTGHGFEMPGVHAVQLAVSQQHDAERHLYFKTAWRRYCAGILSTSLQTSIMLSCCELFMNINLRRVTVMWK